MRSSLQSRAVMILDILDQAENLLDLNLPGLDFHSLKGFRPKRYTVHVNDGEVHRVNLEQYH